MFRVVCNQDQDLTIEDFINLEYEEYVLCDNAKLSPATQELKKAWKMVIDRLLRFGVLEGEV